MFRDLSTVKERERDTDDKFFLSLKNRGFQRESETLVSKGWVLKRYRSSYQPHHL